MNSLTRFPQWSVCSISQKYVLFLQNSEVILLSYTYRGWLRMWTVHVTLSNSHMKNCHLMWCPPLSPVRLVEPYLCSSVRDKHAVHIHLPVVTGWHYDGRSACLLLMYVNVSTVLVFFALKELQETLSKARRWFSWSMKRTSPWLSWRWRRFAPASERSGQQ